MIETTRKISELNVVELKTLQSLLANLYLYPASEIDGIYGPKTERAWASFKRAHYLGQIHEIGPASYQKLVFEATFAKPILITRTHFDQIFYNARSRDRDTYFLPINQAMAEFEINNLRRIAAFLAQIGHESGNLRYSEEIASGAAYENRWDLGNTQKGDGMRFKGRGLIQLTGRDNYRTVGKVLKLDLINNPKIASQPLNAARIAGYFWKSRGLNELADYEKFKTISLKINGGYNGYFDRVSRWNHAKEVLGC